MPSKVADLLGWFNDRYIPEPNSGCWLWAGSVDHKGYGRFGLSGVMTTRAHRFSYINFKGKIPRGKIVMHICDVPSCVNPDHLKIGTNQENMDDMNNKGRHAKMSGRLNPRARLSVDDIIAIRASNEKLETLSRRFGVKVAAISKIRRRKLWQCVP